MFRYFRYESRNKYITLHLTLGVGEDFLEEEKRLNFSLFRCLLTSILLKSYFTSNSLKDIRSTLQTILGAN